MIHLWYSAAVYETIGVLYYTHHQPVFAPSVPSIGETVFLSSHVWLWPGRAPLLWFGALSELLELRVCIYRTQHCVSSNLTPTAKLASRAVAKFPRKTRSPSPTVCAGPSTAPGVSANSAPAS